MRSAVSLLPLLAIAALGACATASPERSTRGALLLSEAPAPASRDCRIVPLPHPALAADQLVDSAALAHSLRELVGQTPGGHYAIVSLATDVNGWNARREVIEHDLRPEQADSLRTLVFHHLRQHEPGEPWGARLRVEMADEIRFRVGHQELCPPRLRSPGDVFDERSQFDVRSSDRAAVSTPLNTVWMRVELDAAGVVRDVRLLRAAFTIRNEAPLLNRVRSLTFDPALMDGVPIASVMSLPLRVR